MKFSTKLLLPTYTIFALLLAGILGFSPSASAQRKRINQKTTKTTPSDSLRLSQKVVKDTVIEKSGKAPAYRPKDRFTNRFIQRHLQSPLIMKDPKNLKDNFVVDPAKKQISITEKIGNSIDYRPPQSLSVSDYMKLQNTYVRQSIMRDYENLQDGKSATSGRGLKPLLEKSPLIDRIFGGNTVSAKPNGFVTLDAIYRHQFVQNPLIPIYQQTTNTFDFNEHINTNLNTKIGDKMGFLFNFDTKAAFNFDNKLKLNFKNQPEDILQAVEAGNISFPLQSQLIPGVQNLFGVKAKMRFGKLDVTVVASQQRSRTESIRLNGGSQSRIFEIRCDNYDENRHFFLSSFFRNNYEKALKTLPMNLSESRITRMEVYVTNRTTNVESMRNVAGFADLGDANPYNSAAVKATNGAKSSDPVDSKNNDIYTRFVNNSNFRNVDNASQTLESYGLNNSTDFEILRGAKRLTDREFKFNAQLGYISLVTPLRNDEVLAVAYEYSYRGRTYKVGEMTEDYANRKDNEVIMLKLLKSSTIRNHVNTPMWDLMMKNVYSLNTTQVSKQGFQMRIIYKDDQTGLDEPILQEGRHFKDIPLLKVFGLDNLNSQNDRVIDGLGNSIGDGNFDFIEDMTIDTKLGKIFLPVLEPFGSYLTSDNNNRLYRFDDDEGILKDKYVYTELYRSTLSDAQQITTKNKFFFRGSVQSSNAAEIQLPLGVSATSVKVTAGGVQLQEGTDYTLDQQLSRVKIINQSVLNSAREIRIDYERPDLFNTQIRTMLGTRLDYNLSKDFHIGGTFMSLKETPAGYLTRVAVGNEPVNNVIFGTDLNFRKDSRWLTRMLDGLPGIQTKEISSIKFAGEYAMLIPGVNNNRVNGNAMVDDFEAARNINDLARQPTKWRLGSTPLKFQGATTVTNPYPYNFNRAKISTYTIDQSLFLTGISTIDVASLGIDPNNVYEKPFSVQDIFPGRSIPVAGLQLPQNILDISYFPKERGMYNYNPKLDNSGFLAGDPRQNFGAVMRGLTMDNDFDNSNVEYVEFYMLDPFISGPTGTVNDGTFNTNNTTGGKLLLHLGDVSEDVVPNGRFDFENGLQAVSITTPNAPTAWGQSPNVQFLSDAFDNQEGAREKQDVGLDGLSDDQESNFPHIKNFLNSASKIVTDPTALSKIQKDPSADDYEYFLTDQGKKSLIGRYKNFMGMENNSPNSKDLTGSAVNPNSPSPTSTQVPDKEDINGDNTINDVEAFYEYEIDLRPNKLVVGNGYIVDKVTTNGVTWYQFRVPIRQFTRQFGDISGFKSIRFMRMVLTDFQQPVVLRFASFQLVSNQYRVYNNKITNGVLTEIPEPYDAQFKVGTVSVEENGCDDAGHCAVKDGGTPYVVPPGFVRDRDFTAQTLVQFNEQSLSMGVTNLKDGDSRAVFKNTKFDLVNYKRLQMFIHMENDKNEDNMVGAFMRVGTDLLENYYEIELPKLKATPIGSTDPNIIWPADNNIDVSIAEIIAIKGERDRTGASLNVPFTRTTADGKYNITIIGKPDFSSVQTIMLGVRNPKSPDEQPKSFKIWVDELRVNGFNQTAGQAATATANIKLADIGTLTINGLIRTYGFGGVQDRISDRARETTQGFGIVAALQLDKFLPEKWGLKIPFFINYDKTTITPHFNPLDPDMPLADALNNINDAAKRDIFKKIVIDNSSRRGFNFSNVRKSRTNTAAKQHFYDIENFSFTYAQNNISKSNILLDEYTANQYKGGLTYQFSPKQINWEPFKNKKSLDRPFLYWIKDLNFNPLPTLIAFRTDFNRSYIKTQYRGANYTSTGVDYSTAGIQPTFEKNYLKNRYYDLQWNFTKSIIFSYAAQENAVVDEPYGNDQVGYKLANVVTSSPDTLKPVVDKTQSNNGWTNFWKLGRTKNFDQRISATYRLPLDKFQLLDWIQADAKYSASFKYSATSYNLRDSLNVLFGNTISNSREEGIQGKIDFVKLYNKLKYLRFANSPSVERKRQTRNPGDDENIEVPQSNILKSFTRLLLTVRGINFNYNQLETTVLPGFLPSPSFFGMDFGQNYAPGSAFVFGSQNPDILTKALQNGWLSKSTEQNQQFVQTITKRFDFSTNLEPFKDFRMQIRGQYNRGDSYSEYFRPTTPDGDFVVQNPVRTGNFSMSFWSFKTAFTSTESSGTYRNQIFENMKSYRQVILDRLVAQKNLSGEGYTGGYNLNSQDVLIPAFFAAYSGKDPKTVRTNPFLSFPMPNWRVDYSGLASLAPFKKIFSSLTLTHSYSSTYSVGNFTSSLDYGSTEAAFINLAATGYTSAFKTTAQSPSVPLLLRATDIQFIPVFVMSTISMQEKFAPMIGIQFTTKSSISGRIEYNQDRNIALNLSNTTVAEMTNKDFVFGVGFKKNNVKLPFRTGDGKIITLKNDLNFQLQFTIRDTKALIRHLDSDAPYQIVSNNANDPYLKSPTSLTDSQPTQGNYNFQFKPSIQYQINKKVSMNFYIERLVNTPFVTNYSYPRSSTTGGLQVKFNLAEL